MNGLQKRSMSLDGHRTSVALEPEFWTVLEVEAARQNTSIAGLVARIDEERGARPLASALRVWALTRVSETQQI
jgi:predicted DNA-binding ribbon-helix-helix protein